MFVKRHELKYLLNKSDHLILEGKLDCLLKRDSYSLEKPYVITSIYFDDFFNKALYQKLDGDSYRYKFRIRYYNNDLTFFKLEKKSKIDQITSKQSVILTYDEVDNILNNEYKFLLQRDESLCTEFYIELSKGLLKPKVIVEYERMAFVHPISDLRITFDTHIRSSFSTDNYLQRDVVFTENIEGNNIVLEVKSNGDIPSYLKSILQLPNSAQTSVSKYVHSRKYNYNF